MKIAMIGQKGMPAVNGGVERHVQELAVRLVRYGHEVTVYGRPWYTKTGDATIHGVTVKNTGSIHTKHLDTVSATFFATLDALRGHFDVIHYHGVGPALLSWIPKIFAPRTAVVTTFHCIDRKHAKWGTFARYILKIGEWAACSLSDKTIVVSRTLEQYARDVYDQRATYIPNGVTLPTPFEANTDALKEWSLVPGQYLLSVSRFIPHKNLHQLIAAWNELCATKPELVEEKKLVIVGEGHYTDAYTAELKNLAKNNPRIVFTGYQHGATLDTLYAHAYAFVHPSLNEGMPMVVLEAMSHRLPVLLSDIPEHRELTNDSNSLFAHGNADALIVSLFHLLTLDEETRRLQGAANRAAVEVRYDWDRVTKDTIALYRSIVGRPAIDTLVPSRN